MWAMHVVLSQFNFRLDPDQTTVDEPRSSEKKKQCSIEHINELNNAIYVG